MNIDEQLNNLAHETCPKQVDVVDRVMEQVRAMEMEQEKVHTPLAILRSPIVLRRVAVTAVAAVAALVIVNVATARSYDEEQLGSMMAYFSNYDNYTVESAAVNSIEDIYDSYVTHE